MANEYITVDQLKATLELSGQSFADHDIGPAVEAASRAVDNLTGRQFYLTPAALPANEARTFSALNGNVITIDDINVITSVVADGTTLVLGTDYHRQPSPGAGNGPPWDMLWTDEDEDDWPLERDTIVVTGQWGWPTVPAPVKTATGMIATQLLRRMREAPFGVVAFGADGEAVRISRTDPHLNMLLEPYTRVALVA